MFLITGFAMVIMAVLLVFYLTPGASKEGLANIGQETHAKQERVSSSPGEEGPLSLGLGGDVCFGLQAADIVKKEGANYPWTAVSVLIQDYDLSVVNLEGPICTGGTPNRDQTANRVKADPSCTAGMAEAGIDAVSLANDHTMDYGSAGLQETLNFLEGQHLQAFGAGTNRRLAEQPVLLESQGGTKVAVVGLCDVATASYNAGESSPGVGAADRERIAGIIQQAGKLTPYVVAFFHWGESGSTEVTQRQRDLAHACVEAGATLVVGCHPHVIQGLEMWQGTPIIYSLGNMVFDNQGEQGTTGLFAGCHFDGGGLTSLEIVPLRTDRARPESADGDEAELILRQVAKASPGVDLSIDPQTHIAYLNL